MNESGGRFTLISREGERCPGCLFPYTSEIGNSPTFVKRTARIIPGCSHNLCENCIAADGGSTGQVSCRHPGCSTKMAWTGGIEEFQINLFLLGSAAAYNQQTLQPCQDGDSEAFVASPEPQEDNCKMLCSECVEVSAECLCQQCNSNTNLCFNCFDKIHKDIKIFVNHKSRPIHNDFVEEKKEQYLKISHCDDHRKINLYVADDGREGCDECVIFGKLKGLNVVGLKEVEEKVKNELKLKIGKGKKELDSLKTVLSDLESDKDGEISNSPENMVKKIKAHFSFCYSQLQTLENSLYQKLKKDQAKLDAWQADMETSVKSTESKIKQLTDIVKFAEEALEKVSTPGIYDFNEMMTVLSKLVDGPSEILRKSRPSTGNIKIGQGFMNLLKSHVTLSHNSEVERGPSTSVPVDDILENVVSESFPENLVGEIANENVTSQNITENLFSQSDTEHSVCENAGDTQSNDVAALERNKGKCTTTKKLTFSKEVNDKRKKIDLVVQERESIGKTPRVKRRPSHAKPFSTTRRSSNRSKCAPSVAEERQDGNNNENRCSDAQDIRNLRKKIRKLKPFKIKPATSKKVANEKPEQSTSASKKSSVANLKRKRDCTLCSSKFPTPALRRRHVKYKHTHEKDFKCTECDYKSVEKGKVKRHMSCHTGEKPYQCEQCSMAFPTTTNLNRHIRTHTGEKPYECKICLAKFAQLDTLKAHREIHKHDRPRFPCDVCPKTFGRKYDLDTHYQRNHTSDKKKERQTDKDKDKVQFESEDEVEITREIEAGDLKMTQLKVEIEDHGHFNIPSFTDDETTTTRSINFDDNAAQVKEEPENEDGI